MKEIERWKISYKNDNRIDNFVIYENPDKTYKVEFVDRWDMAEVPTLDIARQQITGRACFLGAKAERQEDLF